MKKIIAVLAIYVFAGQASAYFYTGNDIVKWSRAGDRIAENRAQSDDYWYSALLVGYAIATYDGYSGYLFCSPANASSEQVVAIVKKYVNERPARWGEVASNLMIDALRESFPCAKRH
ncbi:Rap1a/Tai family immunity protein [Glaciimonas immobilis]|uniref:Rap1a immunity protein domain-containing protein n=1 Tax=Glaciimonas immobilis TaxID=728004 RepID=A0A840RNH0_9BURK|nr:Rap1a/Tai family immunity protein [Glaciimonas immobilis]KAF3999187.1 hypothetical protein HAV38_04420 [Glaciimonas immobilis]MBB5198642.1 hypothetical protein [Glaciimonas immobilis]